MSFEPAILSQTVALMRPLEHYLACIKQNCDQLSANELVPAYVSESNPVTES